MIDWFRFSTPELWKCLEIQIHILLCMGAECGKQVWAVGWLEDSSCQKNHCRAEFSLLENPWYFGAKDFSLPWLNQEGQGILPITQNPPYLVGQHCVNLLQQLFLHIRVQGQLIGQVPQAVAGGLIPSKDKDECLGQDLYVCQGCGEMRKAVLVVESARTRQHQVVARQVCCSCFLITPLWLLYLPGKIHFIGEAGDLCNWQGSPAPCTGIWALAPGTEFHLELISEDDGDTNTSPHSPHSHSPVPRGGFGCCYLYQSDLPRCSPGCLSAGIQSSAAGNLPCPERESRRVSLVTGSLPSDKQTSQPMHNF